MGILSGLGNLGLGGLEGLNIFEEEKKEEEKAAEKAQPPKMQEKDLIFEKSYKCPVCDNSFPTKIMKTGKAKLIRQDKDLRGKYDIIDPVKYDVMLCPTCGYAALTKYFGSITPTQKKMIQEQVSKGVKVTAYKDEIYTYEQAIERYKLALVCAVVKKGKASEKAYICLKSAWLLRGYQEFLVEQEQKDEKLIAELKQQEEEYLMNAFKGFAEANQSESYPMCGMDEITVNYLMAVFALRFKKYEMSAKLVGNILTSSAATPRMKDKARDLKDEILAEMKKAKG